MTAVEKALLTLVPTLAIRPKWRLAWKQNDLRSFKSTARVFFTICAAGYVAHYFLIDLPLGKTPVELWARYRFGCAAAALFGFGMTYHQSLDRFGLTRAPLLLCGVLFSYLQGASMLWRPETPYFYSILIPVVSVAAWRKSAGESALYLVTLYAFSAPAWLARPSELPYIVSAAIVGMLGVGVLRSRLSSDVESFIANQEKLEAQSALIQAQLDLNDQVRSFLPKEIYRRIEEKMRVQRRTVLQALDEVLRCRRTPVACIYSDIRGFTQKSKDLDNFVLHSALPNMRTCTEIVEAFGGVPRLIGDLVFGYFDQADPKEAYLSALRCAGRMAAKSNEMNSDLPEKLRTNRYVLLSFGEAIVGNTGGSGSSWEITVLGPPANILSRLDSLSKIPKFASLITGPMVILTQSAGDRARAYFPGLEMRRLDLQALGLEIRDFPEESGVFLVPIHAQNRAMLSGEAVEAAFDQEQDRSTPIRRVA